MPPSSRNVTVSLGVTSMLRDPDEVADLSLILESLQRKADNALYRSKSAGRNQAHVYVDQPDGEAPLFLPDI